MTNICFVKTRNAIKWNVYVLPWHCWQWPSWDSASSRRCPCYTSWSAGERPHQDWRGSGRPPVAACQTYSAESADQQLVLPTRSRPAIISTDRVILYSNSTHVKIYTELRTNLLNSWLRSIPVRELLRHCVIMCLLPIYSLIKMCCVCC